MITNERIKTDLKTKDFWYDLPEELIAQHPSEVRDMARLMTVDRKTGGIGHHIFHDIVDMLNPGDVMVINDSKVIPARLYGTKVSEGHAHVEVVLLRQPLARPLGGAREPRQTPEARHFHCIRREQKTVSRF